MMIRLLLAAFLTATVLAAACGGGRSPKGDASIQPTFLPTFVEQPTLPATFVLVMTPTVPLTSLPSVAPDVKAELGDAQAHFEAGLALQGNGEIREAFAEYGQAIRLDPTHSEAYNYRVLNLNRKAIEDFNEAIRLNPQYAREYNNRGDSFADLGQYQRAIRDYDKAISFNPLYAWAFGNRGVAYAPLGKTERAIQDLDQAIVLDPQFAQAYAGRPIVNTLLEKEQEALQDLDQAVELGFTVARWKGR